MAKADLLFWNHDLRSTLDQHAQKARAAVASLSAAQVAGDVADSVIAELEKEYHVAPLKLHEEGVAVEHEEVRVDVSQDPMRSIFDRSRPRYIPSQQVRYIVPFEGDSTLWECKPSTFNLNPPRAKIEGTELVFQFEVPNNEVSRTKQ